MLIKLLRKLWKHLVAPNSHQGYFCLETRRVIFALSLQFLLLSLFQ